MSAKRRSQREWARIIGTWERSGLSQAEFCGRRKLSLETFGWWRWRLGKETPRVVEDRAPAFVEVAVAGPPAVPASRPVVIELPGAVVVRIEQGFDEDTLRRVVAVLTGGHSC